MARAVHILLISLLLCVQAGAATYYVSTTNAAASDDNDGSSALPWLTIGKATATVAAGDTVIVKAGTYNEAVLMATSGTAGSPITFTGERDASGNWLTIVDAGTAMTNWYPAPEIGAGVYVQTNLSNPIVEMTVGASAQRVPFVYTMTNGTYVKGYVYTAASGVTNGYDLLNLASDAVVTLAGGTNQISFWDGTGAIFCSTGTVCYLRFKNGDDPNTNSVRGLDDSGYGTSGTGRSKYAVGMNGKSYIVWSNFCVRGAPVGIYLWGTAHHNTIVSNRVTGCYAKVYLYNGPYLNTVSGNAVSSTFYGGGGGGTFGEADEDGAFGNVSGAYTYAQSLRANSYAISKYFMGQSSSFDEGLFLYYAGSNNVIAWNAVSNCWGNGLNIWGNGTGTHTASTDVYSNAIHNVSSAGVLLERGQYGTRIHDNLIYDCNLNFRAHQMGFSDTNRLVYIYRNRCWLPAGVGDQIFLHWTYSTGASNFPTFWWYHNDFLGGYQGFRNNGWAAANGGCTNFHLLNNLWCSNTFSVAGASTWFSDASMVKECDYNIANPALASAPAWFGAHTINTNTAEWQVGTTPPSFALSATSLAINAGMNIPTTYPTLPQTSEPINGSAPDIGAYEWLGGYGAITSLNVTNLIIGP